MGDRHGGRFARRGRALSPPHPQVDAHRAVGFRWRATVFRWRGVVGRICPAREHAPRRRPTDTAHGRKDLPRAGTLPTAKASRHGARAKGFARAGTLPTAKASRHDARAKGFAPRRNALLGEGLPTRRTGERICPAQKRSPRRKPPDTAHGRKDLPRAGTLSSAKASRHGARAKGFAPRGFAFAPRGDERRAALDRRTAGKTPLRRGRTRDGAAAAEFIHRKK